MNDRPRLMPVQLDPSLVRSLSELRPLHTGQVPRGFLLTPLRMRTIY